MVAYSLLIGLVNCIPAAFLYMGGRGLRRLR
jgi:hypothetical protein